MGLFHIHSPQSWAAIFPLLFLQLTQRGQVVQKRRDEMVYVAMVNKATVMKTDHIV